MDDQSKYRDSDWIDAYLFDELSEAQNREFEEALRRDAELREKVDTYKVVKDGVEASGREELKQRLKQLEGLVTEETEDSKRTRLWYGSRIAAVIILLILPFYFILSDLNEVDSEEVYISHFEPYPVLANGTVRGDQADSPLTIGLQLYERGDYQEAIESLEKNLRESEDSNTAQFYLALSYLAADVAARAIPVLERLSGNEQFKLREQAKWYLGLAFLKNNQTDKARDTFQSLYENGKDPGLKLKAERVLDDM